MRRLIAYISDDPAGQTLATRFAWLLLLNVAFVCCFTVWRTLLDNFAVNEAAFTGAEIGTLQTLREIPGFLAFLTVFILIFIREQRFALLSIMMMAVGVALTGFFPNVAGLYFTTVLMSLGFHYFETVNQSLALQWLPKARAPILLARMRSAESYMTLLTLGTILLAWNLLNAPFWLIYFVAGATGLAAFTLILLKFPLFPETVVQTKKLILRRRYWLYYLLTFGAGARRQIFVVFAGFMLVEKFGFSVTEITLLYLANQLINGIVITWIGKAIAHFGERTALIFEYAGLMIVFTMYAFVEAAWLAALLFIVDHLLFGFAIAQKTYLQKIAAPEDMAATASVSFTINHIAAVFLPVLLGVVWLTAPHLVFLTGAALAGGSLILSLLVPRHPVAGRETIFSKATPAGDG